MLLLAALVGAASMSAQAGVHFGFSFGIPVPVIVSRPVVVAAPVAPCPAPVVQVVPACPGADYVWAPGYWSYRATGYAWVPGAWNYRPVHAVYAHNYYGGHFYGGHR